MRASGLLCGALAVVVLFTNRHEFFSPLAVRSDGSRRIGCRAAVTPPAKSRPGAVVKLAGVVGDLSRHCLRPGRVLCRLAELPPAGSGGTLALGAVASFGVSGVIIVRSFPQERHVEV